MNEAQSSKEAGRKQSYSPPRNKFGKLPAVTRQFSQDNQITIASERSNISLRGIEFESFDQSDDQVSPAEPSMVQ